MSNSSLFIVFVELLVTTMKSDRLSVSKEIEMSCLQTICRSYLIVSAISKISHKYINSLSKTKRLTRFDLYDVRRFSLQSLLLFVRKIIYPGCEDLDIFEVYDVSV